MRQEIIVKSPTLNRLSDKLVSAKILLQESSKGVELEVIQATVLWLLNTTLDVFMSMCWRDA